MQFISTSAKQTQRFAQELAQKYKSGGIIALTGELGAGKTTFTQGFAKGLGIKEKIISPTFVLIRQYPLPNSKSIFYHLDLYRLDSEFNNIGLDEIFSDKNAIILIEWAEKLGDLLPKNTKKIYIEILDDDSRRISMI